MRTTLLIGATLLTGLAFSFPAAADGEVENLYSDYAELLDAHLTEKRTEDGGLVSAFDYQAALDDEETSERLVRQRSKLASFDPESLDDRQAATAFWLNAYNFFMIAHILEERPDGELVDSVWDYGGRYNPFRGNVFERELFEIGGEDYSLDEMEKDILLGEGFEARGWKDARVHFAVNCASVGCPPLRESLYTASNVDELLEENTRRAMRTHYHLQVDDETLRLSSLFDWYESDFVEASGSVRAFVREHASDETIAAMESTRRIEYIDYDWALNRPGNFPEFRPD